MIAYLKKEINTLIDNILMLNTSDVESVKRLMEQIVQEIFSEESIVYIDKVEDSKMLVEIHFVDSNFYELEFNKEDSKDDFIRKIQDKLVSERIIDKQDSSTNGNNRRYFQNEIDSNENV